MQIYPAIKAHMGRWDYYLVRMSMRELAENIRYAEEIHGPTQLSDAIQRELKRSRATKEIASYLVKQEDRFFSSIVVAVLDGEPQWHPVSLEDNPEFRMLSSDRRLSEAFGVLTFNGEQNYYALDGQHRLSAIRQLLDGETDFTIPQDFRHEEVSVIFVLPRQLEETHEFIVRYRRLFGNLNRYAKPMSQYDNIVMDEDDAIAIITRRLVSSHPFFKMPGLEFESSRIKMSKGKNIQSGSSHFTSLEMLYDINEHLLATADRRNRGWGANGERIKEYKRFRPPDNEIDALEAELVVCWDALTSALPILNENPALMRVHNPPSLSEGDSDDSYDCVLFWPIVQMVVADLARTLLDHTVDRIRPSDGILTALDANRALEPLGSVTWDAHTAPWRHILLVQSETSSWRIASEDRKNRLLVLERIIRWQLGIDSLMEDEVTGEGGLRELWYQYLPATAAEEEDAMWQEIIDNLQR